MTTATPDAPASSPAKIAAPTMYAVRAQHDGVSHFLVREAANVQSQGPNGYMINTPEVLTLGVHTATVRRQIGPNVWDPSDPTLVPPDELEVLRFTTEGRAQEVADRANQNPAGFVWYTVAHEWSPPPGYVPPANSEAADMLEARNAALRIQLATLQQRQLEQQIAEAEAAQSAPPVTPAINAPIAEAVTTGDVPLASPFDPSA